MQYPALYRCSARGVGRGLLMLAVLVLGGCSKTEFDTADGATLEWDSLRGQWVLVNYWAEWCKPCLEEIPELNALHRARHVTVLGVNFDGIQGQQLRELGNQMGITFTLLTDDPGPGFGWQRPVALPATLVVNPDGDLVEARFGPQTERELNELMGR
ncbi:TlpA family protein disulfide reductase [Marinobacter sp. X15-166B]|uniref:TlpA family protein disulfide reductase n=1 Tax=Marinobacter sp. X15-166B TaxID=1897620 RepID=UPI00085CDB35|nr:TlpA disulfide reductase family protein [Marinobacter sp. X15-166B]OEY67823.1 redoxin [Marinobacter sp. X15-166B]